MRIATYHHYIQNVPADPAADIRLTWEAPAAAPEDRVLAFKEAARPVCLPAYPAEHTQALGGPVAGWSGLTLLDLVRPNEGWASWEDWFARAGHPAAPPRRLGLDSYVYVLEDAAAGSGVALGWRHYVEWFLEAGTLVALRAPGRRGLRRRRPVPQARACPSRPCGRARRLPGSGGSRPSAGRRSRAPARSGPGTGRCRRGSPCRSGSCAAGCARPASTASGVIT